VHGQILLAIQDELDKTARECLRAIVTRDMEIGRMRRLAKFCFGCMNQKHELPRRIAERGLDEAVKVLEFLHEANEALVEVLAQSELDHGH
jgi:hypothetical protein